MVLIVFAVVVGIILLLSGSSTTTAGRTRRSRTPEVVGTEWMSRRSRSRRATTPVAAGSSTLDRTPASEVASNDVEVEMASPVRTADEPPLLCTYRKSDVWREGSSGVCLAEMDDGVVVRVLPACMHYFHAACVGEWLHAHATCPLVAPAKATT